MRSRIFTLLCAVFASTALAGWSLPATAEDETADGDFVEMAATPEAPPASYLSIMGEVVRPGTYQVDPSDLTLHTLLKNAQGFRENASTAIRLIRRGRFSQIEIYSESDDTRLRSGDLLIVESKSSGTGDTADKDQDESETDGSLLDGTELAQPEFTQIALVNLMEYPVVLRLRPQRANARSILEALDLPVTLLDEVHVITPNVPNRLSSEAAKQAAALQHGSVLVFVPDEARRRELVGVLPRPTDMSRSKPEFEELAGPSAGGRSAPRKPAGPPLNPSSQGDPFAEADELQTPASDVVLIPSDEANAPQQGSTEVEETTSSQFRPVAAAKLLDASTPEATPLTPVGQKLHSQNLQKGESNFSTREDPTIEGDEEEITPASQRSFVHLLIIVLAVGSLVAAALLLRHSLERMALKIDETPDRLRFDSMPTLAQLSQEYPVPTRPSTVPAPKLLSEQLRERAEELAFPKMHVAPAELTDSGETSLDILKWQQNASSTSLGTSYPMMQDEACHAEHTPHDEHTPYDELRTIPFPVALDAALKVSPRADDEPRQEEPIPQKNVAENDSYAAPLAMALFQLENKRQD